MKVTTPNSTTFIQYADEDDVEESSKSDALTKNHSTIEHHFQQPPSSSANIDGSELVDDDNARRKRLSIHNNPTSDKDVMEIATTIGYNRPSTFVDEVLVYDSFYDRSTSNQDAQANDRLGQQGPTVRKNRRARIVTPPLSTITNIERAVEDEDDDEGMLMDERRIFKLNVGGKSYRFRREVILECREPDSLLSILIRADHHKRLLVVDGYAQQTGEYYLERNSKIAEYIVEYFLTGKLHKPSDICLERFREELLFWHLTNVELAPCCSILADASRIDETLQIERELDEVECLSELRKVIWHLMENPSSSSFSKMFSFVSIAFIFTSVVGLIMGSMPEFQVDSRFAEYYHIDVFRKSGALTRNNAYYRQHQQTQQSLYYDDAGNTYLLLEQQQQRRRNMNDGAERQNRSVIPPAEAVARQVVVSAGETLRGMLLSTRSAEVARPNNASPEITTERSMTLTEFVYRPTDNPHHHLIVLEYICITWFTVEFIVRLLVSPKKILFLKRPMNLIDLFTVFPIFIELSLSSLFGVNADQLKELTGAMLVIRILRVLRMARVFKLARYSMGLQVFGYTLRSSLRELCMLSMFLVTGTVFFSTIMYFLEKDEPGTDFGSIPAACWWCIITVTTVGYGDCLVTTTLGKAVAAIASIFGIIILAFPISMVVENFAYAQEQSHVENQIREAQMAAVANDYLMRRYPSRRKACRDPLGDDNNFSESMRGGGGTVAAASAIHQARKRRSSISAYHSIRLDNRRANHPVNAFI